MPRKDLTRFGRQVERIMLDLGMSNSELERRLGWTGHGARLGGILRARRPHNATIRKIAEALGVRPSDFQDCFINN